MHPDRHFRQTSPTLTESICIVILLFLYVINLSILLCASASHVLKCSFLLSNRIYSSKWLRWWIWGSHGGDFWCQMLLLLSLIFDLENGDHIFFWNIGLSSQQITLQPRSCLESYFCRLQISVTPYPCLIPIFYRSFNPLFLKFWMYRLYSSTSVYLWLYSPFLGLGRFFSFLIFYTVGKTPWAGDDPVARPLSAQRIAQTQNKRTQTSMPWVGFEPTIPVFEGAGQFIP
jgi:hypothetical protein